MDDSEEAERVFISLTCEVLANDPFRSDQIIFREAYGFGQTISQDCAIYQGAG